MEISQAFGNLLVASSIHRSIDDLHCVYGQGDYNDKAPAEFTEFIDSLKLQRSEAMRTYLFQPTLERIAAVELFVKMDAPIHQRFTGGDLEEAQSELRDLVSSWIKELN